MATQYSFFSKKESFFYLFSRLFFCFFSQNYISLDFFIRLLYCGVGKDKENRVMNDEKQNILIIKLGALGDFIMQMDYVAAIHKTYPNAHITFMTSKPFVPFVKCMNFVNHIIVDTHPRWNLKAWYRLCKCEIADKKWDYIFDLQNSKRTRKRYFNLVRFFSAYPVKWCVWAKGGLLNVKEVAKNGRFRLGKISFYQMTMPLEAVDLSFLKGEQKHFDLLPKEKFILFVPGCSPKHPYKRWAKEKYTELANLIESKLKLPVVVLGTKAESDQIDFICNHSKAISFKDKATLLDIPALANRALCVIGNDTGPMHMACFCKTYGIVLFCGITAKSAQHLDNVKNIIAEQIDDISVSEVFEQINALIQRRK